MTEAAAVEAQTEAVMVEAQVGNEPAAFDADAAMDKVWDRLQVNNGADRADNGKFTSPNQDKTEDQAAASEENTEKPLEGGEEEGAEADHAAVAADVPLPANWVGKDELWGKLTPEVRAEIAEHQREQHAKLSDYGRKVASYQPLSEAAEEFAEYFNGNLKGADGQPINPADGIRYLANIQRQMDRDPVSTALSIIDTYGVREKIAAQLGVKAEDGQQPDTSARENALLQKIDRLEAAIRETSDPSRIEQVIEKKQNEAKHRDEVSRLMDPKSKPLIEKIPEKRLVYFINEAWETLGADATKDKVFDHAYNAAVEADPALRALSKAATSAAEDKAAKAEAAKRANGVNLKSSSAGKARTLTEDEQLEAKWQELQH